MSRNSLLETINNLDQFKLNGWFFVYELSGRKFESRCSHLNVRYCGYFEQRQSVDSLYTRMWYDKKVQIILNAKTMKLLGSTERMLPKDEKW